MFVLLLFSAGKTCFMEGAPSRLFLLALIFISFTEQRYNEEKYQRSRSCACGVYKHVGNRTDSARHKALDRFICRGDRHRARKRKQNNAQALQRDSLLDRHNKPRP